MCKQIESLYVLDGRIFYGQTQQKAFPKKTFNY